MKRGFILLTILCLVFTSGCYDLKEPNDIAYVVALGVDQTDEQGIYEYTIQFAKTGQISGGSGDSSSKEGESKMETVVVKAPSIYSGIHIADQVISKSFTLAHTKLIVLSDEIAKSGVKDLFDAFGRNSEVRANVFIAVANGTAKHYLNEVKPVVEVNPVTYYELIFESERGGYVPQVLLKDFYFHLFSTDKENVLPLAGVNEKNKEEAEKEKAKSASSSGGGGEGQAESFPSQSKEEGNNKQKENPNNMGTNQMHFNYLDKISIAGNIDVEKKNASEIMGMAVFKGDKMIGTMNGIESTMYNMISGNFGNNYITYYDESSPQVPVTILLEQDKKSKKTIDISGDKPIINVTLYLEGQLMSESTKNPIEGDIKTMEGQVEKDTEEALEGFLYKTSQEFDSDIIGFGELVKMKFLTYKGFEDYDWYSHYAQSEFHVKVNFKLRRVGLIDLVGR